MNFKNLKVALFVAILIFYGSFLVYKITLPAAQDLPRQIQNGKDVLNGNFDVLTKNVYSYTEPGSPFANHHWFYGVISFVLLYLLGWSGVVLFKVLFILGTFLLLFYLLYKNTNFWVPSISSIPAIFLLISRTAFRPEIFSYLFLVLYIHILFRSTEKEESKILYFLVPIQLLWVNTHLFFPVGVMMLGGFLVDQIIKWKIYKSASVMFLKKIVLVFVLVVLVNFANPFGLKGVVFSLLVNTNKDFPIASAEIKTVSEILSSEPIVSNVSAAAFFPAGFLLLVSFAVVFLVRYKRGVSLIYEKSVFLFLASIGSMGLSYYVARGMPLFGIIFFFGFGYNLYQIYLLYKDKAESLVQKHFSLVKAIIVGLILFLLYLTMWGQQKIMYGSEFGVGLAKYSMDSANFFTDNDLRGPIFNDTDMGSYLIGTLYPREKVFSDNRFGDAYSRDFFADIYFPLIQDEEKWKEGLEKYKFNTIFFYHYSAVNGVRDFIFRRVYDPEWVWVYADNYAVVFVRNIARNKDIIKKFGIVEDNFIERLEYLNKGKDIITLADLYNLIGRTDLSMPAYMKFVSDHPESGKVWFVLGRTEITKSNQAESNPHLAALFIERAIKEGWASWEVYSYLALAYLRTGQLEKARWAVEKELELDPENPDGHKWLGILADEEARIRSLQEY